jgi:hypothetical protein
LPRAKRRPSTAATTNAAPPSPASSRSCAPRRRIDNEIRAILDGIEEDERDEAVRRRVDVRSQFAIFNRASFCDGDLVVFPEEHRGELDCGSMSARIASPKTRCRVPRLPLFADGHGISRPKFLLSMAAEVPHNFKSLVRQDLRVEVDQYFMIRGEIPHLLLDRRLMMMVDLNFERIALTGSVNNPHAKIIG